MFSKTVLSWKNVEIHAGNRGGQLLPTLLKPGSLKSEEQKRRFREEAGIGGFGDIARLVEVQPNCPRSQ